MKRWFYNLTTRIVNSHAFLNSKQRNIHAPITRSINELFISNVPVINNKLLMCRESILQQSEEKNHFDESDAITVRSLVYPKNKETCYPVLGRIIPLGPVLRDESTNGNLADGVDELLESLVKTATKAPATRTTPRERKRTRHADRKSCKCDSSTLHPDSPVLPLSIDLRCRGIASPFLDWDPCKSTVDASDFLNAQKLYNNFEMDMLIQDNSRTSINANNELRIGWDNYNYHCIHIDHRSQILNTEIDHLMLLTRNEERKQSAFYRKDTERKIHTSNMKIRY